MIFKARPNEYSRPQSSKNWGMCSGHCNQDSDISKTLKEAQLDILTSKACKLLGKSQRVNPNLELCAGKKQFFPAVSFYRMMYSENSEKFWFKLKVNFIILKCKQVLTFLQYVSFMFHIIVMIFRAIKPTTCLQAEINENLNSTLEEVMHVKVTKQMDIQYFLFIMTSLSTIFYY